MDRKPDFYRLQVDVDLRDVEHLHKVMTALEAETDVCRNRALARPGTQTLILRPPQGVTDRQIHPKSPAGPPRARHEMVRTRRYLRGQTARNVRTEPPLVFKRRNPKGWLLWLREMVYPTGGFRRAIKYVTLRMRRLPRPTPPHRARGLRGLVHRLPCPCPACNSLAPGLCAADTRKRPCRAARHLQLEPHHHAHLRRRLDHTWPLMLGVETPLTAKAIFAAFERAESTCGTTSCHLHRSAGRMSGLKEFWDTVYLPYFIGALAPAILTALMCYYITIPLVEAYQKARAAKAKERSEKRGRLRAALQEAAHRIKHRGEDRHDTPPATPDPQRCPSHHPARLLCRRLQTATGKGHAMRSQGRIRPGVNIDHVATVRNARGGPRPDPLRAALLAEAAGADGITAHLREDRRHIRDSDIEALMAGLTIPLNFEMGRHRRNAGHRAAPRPHAVCVVPNGARNAPPKAG